MRELAGVELVRTARLIHGVEQVPLSSDLTFIEASLACEHEGGCRWLSITLSNDSLTMARGESIYEPQRTETSITTILDAEIGVGTNRDGDDPIEVMNDLQDWVAEWVSMALNQEYVYSIDDEEVYSRDTDAAWESLPDGV